MLFRNQNGRVIRHTEGSSTGLIMRATDCCCGGECIHSVNITYTQDQSNAFLYQFNFNSSIDPGDIIGVKWFVDDSEEGTQPTFIYEFPDDVVPANYVVRVEITLGGGIVCLGETTIVYEAFCEPSLGYHLLTQAVVTFNCTGDCDLGSYILPRTNPQNPQQQTGNFDMSVFPVIEECNQANNIAAFIGCSFIGFNEPVGTTVGISATNAPNNIQREFIGNLDLEGSHQGTFNLTNEIVDSDCTSATVTFS